MNKIAKVMMAVITLVVAWSCEKDDEVITATPGPIPTLAASATVLELTPDDAERTVVTFDWEKVDVTWSNNEVATPIIRYTVQIARKGNNFQSVLLTKDTDEISTSVQGAEINAALLQNGGVAGVPEALEARLQVTIAPNRIEYSNIIDMTVTPYDDYVMLPSLWIAGSFNNWSHTDQHRVASLNSDENYEGYLYLPDDNTEFKFSSQANWNGTNYGDGGTNRLNTDGGNLLLPAAGYYLLKVNTETLTWSATEVTWGLIGDAIGGWGDTDDVQMTYDAEAKTWKVTTDMSAGQWKFRANGSWDINFGPGAGPGTLAYGAENNFEIETPGTYLITLDLNDPGYYKYSIELQ